MTVWQRSTWWLDTGSLRRLLADLVTAELARLRPAYPPALPHPADPLPVMTEREQASVAAALAAYFCLPDSGAVLPALQAADWVAALQSVLKTAPGDLSFLTSGSSGEPKPVRQSWLRFEEEAAFQMILNGHRPRIVSLVPAHHIYGFMFTVLLPYRFAAPVVDLRDRRPAAIVSALRPGDLVIGFPQIWKALAQSGRPVPEDVCGITSTAPCPAETAKAVRAAGFARLVELYGSSETMGIGWRDDPDDRFLLFPYWQLEADATVLRHRDRQFTVTLPDLIDCSATDERRFLVRGRHDGAIQIGGINVHPGSVAGRLRGHPGIAEAVVRPYRAGPTLRLKAFLVPADPDADISALRNDVETWMRHHLPAIERPRSLTFGPKLPQGVMGKMADWDAG